MSKNKRNKTPKRDWASELLLATAAYLFGKIDGAALTAAYNNIHASARSAAMTPALQASGDRMGEVLDLFVVTSTTTKSRTSTVTLSTDQVDTVRIGATLRLLVEQLGFVPTDEMASVIDTARTTAATVNADLFSQVCTKVERAVAKVTVGTAVTVHQVKLVDLVKAGTIPAGTTLVGANGAKAIVQADGQVTTSKVLVEGTKTVKPCALSTAASAWKGHQEDGWRFWTHNGEKLANFRANHG